MHHSSNEYICFISTNDLPHIETMTLILDYSIYSATAYSKYPASGALLEF